MIPPLRKRKRDGTLYSRPPQVEALLCELAELPRDEILLRAAATNRGDPSYLPSECLLHLLRASRGDNSDAYFERLFAMLSRRVMRALPRAERGDDRTSVLNERMRDLAYGRFLELISADRNDYEERLDFFEARWDAAIANLRRDAWGKVRKEVRGNKPLEDDETGELAYEVERAVGSFDPFDPAAMNEADYRSRLWAAIDSLPQEQIRIIEMIGRGIQIDSKEPGVVTIARSLGKSEKTIRNHRDKAYTAIRRAMSEGDEQ